MTNINEAELASLRELARGHDVDVHGYITMRPERLARLLSALDEVKRTSAMQSQRMGTVVDGCSALDADYQREREENTRLRLLAVDIKQALETAHGLVVRAVAEMIGVPK